MLSYILRLIKQRLYKFKFSKSVLYSNVNIDNYSKIGYKSVLFSNVNIICSLIGDYSYVQKSTNIINTRIGPYCSIAANVNIGLPDHPTNFISTSPIFYDKSQPLPEFFVNKCIDKVLIQNTFIDADVWIGQSAIIKSGVKVGVGAIIGAASVVTKDVDPYSIVAGIPAKCIKMRFSSDIIGCLLDSKWWELDPSIIKKLSHSFDNPVEFLEKLKCL